MNKNFFEINNVDFSVGGKTKVKNVSFSIENEGDVICLLGPSGIGKTTILRTIAGLEKINDGSIILNGRIISSKKTNIDCMEIKLLEKASSVFFFPRSILFAISISPDLDNSSTLPISLRYIRTGSSLFTPGDFSSSSVSSFEDDEIESAEEV